MPNTIAIFGNWKMHGTPRTWQALLQGIITRQEIAPSPNVTLAIFPPIIAIPELSQQIQTHQAAIQLGAQTVFPAREGAHTGEISPPMLTAYNVKYTLIGHSERRQNGETNTYIAAQVAAALKSGLTPVLCIGETAAQQAANQTEAVLTEQLTTALSQIPANTDIAQEIIIAYEPIWAIGSGSAATPAQLTPLYKFLRNLTPAQLLYGGSVKPENTAELIAINHLSGFLIGGASLDAATFTQIAQNATGVKNT